MKKGRDSILIVEDNLTEQLLIRHAFEEIGVKDHIYTANDGEEAITFLKGSGQYADRDKFRFPTFMLVDLKMPKVNGLELLLYVKRTHLIIIPTIILTSSADPDDVKRAYMLGANAFHTKPMRMEDLCMILKRIYDYWNSVEMPDTDEHGNLKATNGFEKLGEKMQHPVRIDPFSVPGKKS
jgi:CheY-like chemotaxis protein